MQLHLNTTLKYEGWPQDENELEALLEEMLCCYSEMWACAENDEPVSLYLDDMEVYAHQITTIEELKSLIADKLGPTTNEH